MFEWSGKFHVCSMDNCTIVHESYNTRFTLQYSVLYSPLGTNRKVAGSIPAGVIGIFH